MDAIPNSVAITPRVTGPLHPARPGMPDHEGFTFGDFLDVINPLQHLPIIGTLYRRLTGDKMSPTAEIVGGALFGGAIGAAVSIVDVLWTQARGKDFGESVLSWLGFDAAKNPTQLAANTASKDAVEIPPATPPAPMAPPAPAAQIAPAPFRDLRAPRVMPAAAPAAMPAGPTPDLTALIQAMEKQGVDPTVALRAAAAYRNAIGQNAFRLAPAH